MKLTRRLASLAAAFSLVAAAGCSSTPAHTPAPATVVNVAPVASDAPPPPAAKTVAAAPVIVEDSSVLRVSGRDAWFGNANAPVTLVVFGDLQCPFTARLMTTVEQLQQSFGPDLRVVWKHQPLPFHPEAKPAANVAVAVYNSGGPEAFECFLREVVRNQRSLGDGFALTAASMCGMSGELIRRAVDSGAVSHKVDDDVALASKLGVRGTPTTFINGIRVTGAQPYDVLAEHVRDELQQVRRSLEAGTLAASIHEMRVQANYTEPEAPKPYVPAVDTTIYNVPVGQSPVRGPSDALVTIVAFMDFQCPYCARATTTLEQVRTNYGNKVRVVFKHNPLAFHPRAEPASQLAIEASIQRGPQAFWQVHDELFKNPTALEDADLENVARTLRLNVPAVQKAIANHQHKSVIDADQALATRLQATGTPTFFINGRELVGAQPYERFKELIDEVMPDAQALVRRGIPATRVYSEIIKNGK